MRLSIVEDFTITRPRRSLDLSEVKNELTATSPIMISDRPFESISLQDIEQLVANGVGEARRLDFKQSIDASNREAQVELLRDIVALANSEGGLLIYGVREGEGDEAGVAAGIEGISGSPDQLALAIGSLLRDNVDERVSGVLQRSIPLPGGKFIHLIRVPASHLAPHMIANIRTTSPRFFARANTANEPMTARQIKDLARRQDTAAERAATRISLRVEALRDAATRRKHPLVGEKGPENQAILHIAPVFPPPGGWGYEEPEVRQRLLTVRTFGYQAGFQLEYSQHGAFQKSVAQRHMGFLKDGTLEGQLYDVVGEISGFNGLVFVASDLEQAVAAAFEDAAALAADGFLPAPCLCQLHLLGVAGARFYHSPIGRSESDRTISENQVKTDALVLSDWSERDTVMRQLLDHVWQAWGFPRCEHFDEQGRLIRFNPQGYRIPFPDENA